MAQRIVFLGDSITEAGANPGGYIRRMEEAMRAGGIAGELVGAGIGGNKIYDLYFRLEADVLSRHPDVVVVYVGINDVWHKYLTRTGTDLDRFERFYIAILDRLKMQGIRCVLCTPGVIGERLHNANAQDVELNGYAQVVRDLAARYGYALCDLRREFHAYSEEHNHANLSTGILTTDGVHLNERGNQLVADLLLPIVANLLSR